MVSNNSIDDHYFYRFVDRDTALAALVEASVLKEVVDEEGNDQVILTDPHTMAIDLGVPIVTETGVTLTDEEGNEYPETKTLDGYHVNLRVLDPEGVVGDLSSLSEYLTTPSTPTRIFL